MDENGIKAAVLNRIRREAKGSPLPVVTAEFALNGTGIRADMAVLNVCFYGIEIKSAADTLKRLPSQMEGYARYFDRTELIVAPKHLRGLRDINLHGAEVWRQEILGEWQLHTVGKKRTTSGHDLLRLMPELERRRAARVLEALPSDATATSTDQAARAAFEAAFRRRYADMSAAFWSAVRGRPIRAEDVALLSRFRAGRLQARELESERKQRWIEWAAKMEDLHPSDQSSQSSSVWAAALGLP